MDGKDVESRRLDRKVVKYARFSSHQRCVRCCNYSDFGLDLREGFVCSLCLMGLSGEERQ
jgi:hypothetical protein